MRRMVHTYFIDKRQLELHSQILCQNSLILQSHRFGIFTHLLRDSRICEIFCVKKISAKNQSKKITLFLMWQNSHFKKSLVILWHCFVENMEVILQWTRWFKGNFVPFVRGAFEKVTTWSRPILDLPPDQNGQYYQKLTLGSRGLEEHILRITMIFARIIGFMLFTVGGTLSYVLYFEEFLIYEICWACAISRWIPNLQARTIQSHGLTNSPLTHSPLTHSLLPPTTDSELTDSRTHELMAHGLTNPG